MILAQSQLRNCVVGTTTVQVLTVTTMLLEVVLPHELVVVTEYVPDVVTLMVGVVAPVLQTPPLFPDKVTEPPLQNVVAPPAVIVAAVGTGLTVTTMLLEVVLPQELVVVTK